MFNLSNVYICRICSTVGVSCGPTNGSCDSSSSSCDQCLCSSNVSLVYNALFTAMTDYTTDSRGDIGAV